LLARALTEPRELAYLIRGDERGENISIRQHVGQYFPACWLDRGSDPIWQA
jgi:hypothetical protein